MSAFSDWLNLSKTFSASVKRFNCTQVTPNLKYADSFFGFFWYRLSKIFAASLWLFTRLGAEFIPKLDEGSITSMLYKPVGMSMSESLRTDIEVENALLKDFPELTRIFSRIGTSEIASDPMPPNESDVYIFYKPISDWPKMSSSCVIASSSAAGLRTSYSMVNA